MLVFMDKKCYKNSSSINLNSLISLQHSLLTFNTPYRTFIRLHGSNMAFYLYREPSAIYAVFWACWSITLAPVKLHLLSLKAPWQSSPSYKVLILQEYSNWRKKRKEVERKKKKKESNQTREENKHTCVKAGQSRLLIKEHGLQKLRWAV